MKFSLFDHMEDCSLEEVEQLFSKVAPQRRQQALNFKHLFGQYACLKSYVMLHQMLLEEHLIPDDELPEFEVGAHGKPTIKGHPHVHFNISHCKHAILVAVDHQPIGVDVERIVAPKPQLIDYTMTPEEAQAIRTSQHPDVEFTRLWTQKEALLKFQGTGIQGGLKEALTSPTPNLTIHTYENIEKQYIYSIAYTN